MSTPQPSAALSSSTPSSSPPPNSNASTLLFGFLVSALSIFAVFMTFAIVWNRLIARRHAIDAMLARNPPSDSLRHRRPVMWDIWAVPNKQPPSWLDTEVSKSVECSHDLAIDQPTLPTSQWQLKNAIVVRVHLRLCRQNRLHGSGIIIYWTDCRRKSPIYSTHRYLRYRHLVTPIYLKLNSPMGRISRFHC